MPVATWLLPILTVILSGVIAWLAGIAAVSREIEKLAKQRAFDARLDWSLRISRIIYDYQFKTAVLTHLDPSDSGRIAELEHDLDALTLAFNAANKEAMLFGSLRTIRTLELANSRLNWARRDAAGRRFHEDPEFGRRVVNELAFVLADVARDVREQLGLEAIPERDVAGWK